MDGFGDALDGHFDVEDQLSRFILERVRARLRTGERPIDAVESRADSDAHRERVRSFLLSTIGGLPDRPEDLGVETTDRHERDGYAVECVTFESRPNYHVTANCYVPDGDGPHPCILYLCGHSGPARADDWNQKACIDLARNGFVVCIADPPCQGERRQYDRLDVDDTTVSGGAGTFPHAYAGQKCFSAGSTLLRYFLHDARCALDILCRRPEVDEARIGVTGTSGGGLLTLSLALLDDRIAAGAPCCSPTDRYEQVKTGHRTHGEQALVGTVAQGIDDDDFLAALAPMPVYVGAAAHDTYIPIEGVHDTVARARSVYECYDAADALSLTVADAPHAAVYEFREEIFAWFSDQLDAGDYQPVPDPEPLDDAVVQCTDAGSVLDEYPHERTIDDVIAAEVDRRYPQAGQRPDVDEREHYGRELRATVIERFALDREACDLQPRVVHETTSDGLDVRRLWFKTERDPDAVVAGVLVTHPGAETGTDAVSFVGDGVGSYLALYAAAAAESVGRVTLSNLGPSFYEMATERGAPFDERLTVSGVVGDCDVPHALAALADRNVSVDRVPLTP